MWFCDCCCTAFPRVKKVMVHLGSLEDRYLSLEKRVDKLEEKTKNNETDANVKEICRQEIIEQTDIEKRKLNLMVFNVPESEEENIEAKKVDDKETIDRILAGPMKLGNLEILQPVRLGKEPKSGDPVKPRPIKFTVENFEQKNKILKANAELRKETGELKNIYFSPDLTKAQRKEAYLLREQLRYQKNVLNKKNLKISRGRIVEIVEKDTMSATNTEDGIVHNRVNIDDDRGGATAAAVHPSFSL